MRDTTGRKRPRAAPGFLVLATLPALPATPALAAGPNGETVIEINFVETKDRLPPDERRGIVWRHHIVATLSANNRVSESNHAESAGKFTWVKQGQNSESLGDNSAVAVWHVLGPHQLERIYVGKQFLMRADVQITGDNTCSVQVKYILQQGYADVVLKRADTGEFAHFSLPSVVSSQCAIR